MLQNIHKTRCIEELYASLPAEIRHHLVRYPRSFPWRLIATSLPLDEAHIRFELTRQLKKDQDVREKVASGKMHILQTVEVDTMEEYAAEVNRRIIAQLLGLAPTEEEEDNTEGEQALVEEPVQPADTAEEREADDTAEGDGNDDVRDDDGEEQGVGYPQERRRRTF